MKYKHKIYKKIRYCRWTTRSAVSVKILSTTQLHKHVVQQIPPHGTEQIEVSKKVSKFIKQTGGYTVLCTTRDRDSRR